MPCSAFYSGFDLLLTLELIDEIFRKNRNSEWLLRLYRYEGERPVTGSDLHARNRMSDDFGADSPLLWPLCHFWALRIDNSGRK